MTKVNMMQLPVKLGYSVYHRLGYFSIPLSDPSCPFFPSDFPLQWYLFESRNIRPMAFL